MKIRQNIKVNVEHNISINLKPAFEDASPKTSTLILFKSRQTINRYELKIFRNSNEKY